MLFGIAIVVAAVVIAVLLNKSKISEATKQLEAKAHEVIDKIEPVIEEVSEVIPANEVIAEVKTKAKKVSVLTEPKAASKTIKAAPKKATGNTKAKKSK